MPDAELEPAEQRDALHGLAALQLYAAVAEGCIASSVDWFTGAGLDARVLVPWGISAFWMLSSLALLLGRSHLLRRWSRTQHPLREIRIAIACVFASLSMGGGILILVLLSSIPSSGP
ncbi:MAG: hypothetical protein JNM84_08020 [Planctomycetes bacterium]|nr:hypothetical protein [Planctomycetota bacterium]